MKTEMKTDAIVVISDIHAGSRLGLFPPGRKKILRGSAPDDYITVIPSPFQRWLWKMWQEFWNEFVPEATQGDPFILIVNGDAIEGRHWMEKLITYNIVEQTQIVIDLLYPIAQNPKVQKIYFTAGTEVHCDPENTITEMIARQMPPKTDPRVFNELWLSIGGGKRKSALIHITHTTGTTGVSAYESTAVLRELVELQVQAARWGTQSPDFTIRSHRHCLVSTAVPGANGMCYAITTPGWVGKAPYVYRTLVGRVKPPQVGGIVIRAGEHEVYPRCFVRSP